MTPAYVNVNNLVIFDDGTVVLEFHYMVNGETRAKLTPIAMTKATALALAELITKQVKLPTGEKNDRSTH